MKDYHPTPNLLRDRVVLITGAGDGIGRAAARRFAAHGATVILLGRTIRKLEQVYDQIEQAGHPQAAIYPLNLEGASPKDYLELARIIKTEFGRLDGLLHNAATVEGLTPITHYNVEHWYKVTQVNLNAPLLLTQAVLDLMNRSGDASIVFTADEVSDLGSAYWGAYAVAKGGIQTLMKMLAGELETNTSIRVNSIYPGKVRTNLRRMTYPAADPRQWADPEEIMGTYLYLMGPDSRGITGQTLNAQTKNESVLDPAK
jgi:NAD(P)-dependent dehydrogenase (short-subunit alcohol dehydrogenase family)